MDSLRDLLSDHGQALSDLDSRTVLYLLVAVVVGVILGWLFRAMLGKRALQKVDGQWQDQLDQAIRLKEEVNEVSLEAQDAIVQAHAQAAAKLKTQTDSLRGKVDALSKESHVLGDERDELKDRLSKCMALANEAKQHIDQQDVNFTKAGVFYKEQLQNAFEQRTALERKLEHDKSENESLRNLLMSTKAEHESVSNLLTTAQARLKDMEELEHQSIALEAENAELRQEAAQAKRETETLQRDNAEIEALKAQNREFAQILESMESTRKQYESDANRYRTQYEKSEKESETLRFKLSDIEKNWARMQRKEQEARNADPSMAPEPPAIGLDAPQGEPDDLKVIVGIGKIFEATLHSLGVYHFRQIAAFGPAEIARINAELKEFKGRIEHDDWIGQAKELLLRQFEDEEE